MTTAPGPNDEGRDRESIRDPQAARRGQRLATFVVYVATITTGLLALPVLFAVLGTAQLVAVLFLAALFYFYSAWAPRRRPDRREWDR